MKQGDLKKQIIKEGVIGLIVCSVLGAGAYYLGTVSDDYQKKQSSLQTEVNSIKAETVTLHDKYVRVQKNGALYQEAIKKSEEGELSLNRQVLKDRFNQFKSRYALDNLRLSMTGIDEIKNPKYKHKTSVMVSSEVSLEFDALSDEDIYHLVDTMQDELPGIAKIIKFNISRQAKITDDVLNQIIQKGSFALVKGEIKFQWLGAKPVEAAETPAPGAPGAPGMPGAGPAVPGQTK